MRLLVDTSPGLAWDSRYVCCKSTTVAWNLVDAALLPQSALHISEIALGNGSKSLMHSILTYHSIRDEEIRNKTRSIPYGRTLDDTNFIICSPDNEESNMLEKMVEFLKWILDNGKKQ